MAQAQFYKPSGKPEIERRRRMAEVLMKQGQQPDRTEFVGGYAVKQSPLAGLAKALTAGLGGYQEGQAAQMEQQKADAARQAMADALGAYSRSQQGGSTTLQNGETINWNKSSPEQAGNMFANILMGNEDTAPIAIQNAMENVQYEQRFPKELELAKAKALIESQYRAPPAAVQEWEYSQRNPEFKAYKDENRELKATEMKEFFDQQDKINASSDAISQLQRMEQLNTTEGSYEGPMASGRAYLGALAGSEAALNTREIDNLSKNLAASILKSTFGGMPTEGERKFLVDLQGSANKSVAERKRIIENGVALINNRIAQSQQTQGIIQKGDYQPTQPMMINLGPQGQGSNPALTQPYDQIKPDFSDVPPVDLNAPVTGQNPGIQQPLPQQGDVVDGFQFLGGNPADPKSWKRVQ